MVVVGGGGLLWLEGSSGGCWRWRALVVRGLLWWLLEVEGTCG